MKNKIVLALFGITLVTVLCSNSGGYPGNLTGSAGATSGCPSCHGSTSSIGTTVALDSAGVAVTSYHPGVAYTVKITATNNTGSTLPKFGFELSLVKLANAGTSSAAFTGTWGTPPTGVSTHGIYIEHNTPLSPASGTGTNGTVYTVAMPWTAPVAGTGSVKIYGILNAVNNNGSSSGDKAQFATAVTITEAVAAAPVASVSIAITSGSNPTCSGVPVTFTPTPTNGGTSPTYQWAVNGTVVSSGNTFTTSTLTNGQTVTCIMTSNLAGVTGNPATSPGITMTVNSSVTDSVNITTTASTICAGTSVTFTAHPFNGGTPTYQWKVGTTVVGTGSTYTSSALANGNVVTCIMTPTGTCVSPATATSNAVTMTVNPVVTDSVNISATATTICSGTSVTFTAHPFNGGTPTFQWKVGSTVVGTGTTYSSSALANGDVVTCIMTPTGSCVSPATATSNAITMVVNQTGTDSINITSTASTICAGTSVTFTAHPTNGGANPAYQWKVGTTVVGTGATYTSSSLANGNVVTCILTPSGACASPATSTSNAITMTVNPTTIDSVNITSTATTICSGTSVTFTAHPFNGGTPTYQWKVGTTVVGTGSTYTSSSLANGNVVTCIMTPTGSCVSPSTATSNAITMTVNQTGTDSINITTTASTICPGSSVTFTAHPTNGGANPSYQWKIGTTVVGSGSTFTSSGLSNGDIITCILTPSGACATPATSTSNAITMTVSPTLTDSVNISASATTICPGTSVTFTAHPFNGGTPTYQWKVGTTVVGTGSTYTSSALANGDLVTCIMTPTGTCVSPSTATSNAITMTVNPAPAATLVPSGNIAVCSGDSVLLTAGGGTGYQWSNSATTTAIWVSQTGNYNVTVTDGNGCTATPANAANVTQTTATVPTITQSGNVITSSPAVSYQWLFNGNVIGGPDTTQSITIHRSGSFAVSITDANGCHATSIQYSFTSTGIMGIGADLGLSLYPVPNHGSFAIDMPDYAGADFTIYDVYGHALYHQTLTSAHQEISDVDLSPALYFVQATSGGRVQTIKMQVIKE